MLLPTTRPYSPSNPFPSPSSLKAESLLGLGRSRALLRLGAEQERGKIVIVISGRLLSRFLVRTHRYGGYRGGSGAPRAPDMC